MYIDTTKNKDQRIYQDIRNKNIYNTALKQHFYIDKSHTRKIEFQINF